MFLFEKQNEPEILLDNEEYLMEAGVNTYLTISEIYPKVEEVVSTPNGDRQFKKLVGSYMDRNSEKLHTSGPVYLIPFGDTDKGEYFKLFNTSAKELTTTIDKVINAIGTKSEFKLLRGNPIFWLFYCCIRYYKLHNDEKGLNTALAIYALSVYPSIFSRLFKYGANEAVMQYTMDHLSEKFIMKQQGHVFGGLFESIKHSYAFLSPFMADGNDKEVIRWIQRIRNDQKSMLSKICDQFMKNYQKGLRVISSKDSNGEIVLDMDSQNKTSTVEYVGRKVTLGLLTQGINLTRASQCAKISGVSISDTKLYISKIITDKYSDDIQAFVESVLFLYLYDENKKPEDINSRYFLHWAEELFRKTNSNNDNIRNIKQTLDKWAEETGVHDKFKREASRVNYKKAIFFYFILSIQTYNN